MSEVKLTDKEIEIIEDGLKWMPHSNMPRDVYNDNKYSGIMIVLADRLAKQRAEILNRLPTAKELEKQSDGSKYNEGFRYAFEIIRKAVG